MNEPMTLPRPEIETYAFVLRPLAEIAGEVVHPVSGITIGELWRVFPREDGDLQAVQLGC